MWPVMVVTVPPVLAHAAHVIECEDVAIQHSGSEGPVETLDISILSGFAWLDVDQFDAILLRPLAQSHADELRPVVQA